MNIKEIFREELARQGVLNSFPATADNLKNFMGAIEASQIRIQSGVNEMQQTLVNKEQTIQNKDAAISKAGMVSTELESKLVNKQNEIANAEARIEALQKKVVEFQNHEQVLMQQMTDKDSVIERQKSELAIINSRISDLQLKLQKSE